MGVVLRDGSFFYAWLPAPALRQGDLLLVFERQRVSFGMESLRFVTKYVLLVRALCECPRLVYTRGKPNAQSKIERALNHWNCTFSGDL